MKNNKEMRSSLKKVKTGSKERIITNKVKFNKMGMSNKFKEVILTNNNRNTQLIS